MSWFFGLHLLVVKSALCRMSTIRRNLHGVPRWDLWVEAVTAPLHLKWPLALCSSTGSNRFDTNGAMQSPLRPLGRLSRRLGGVTVNGRVSAAQAERRSRSMRGVLQETRTSAFHHVAWGGLVRSGGPSEEPRAKETKPGRPRCMPLHRRCPKPSTSRCAPLFSAERAAENSNPRRRTGGICRKIVKGMHMSAMYRYLTSSLGPSALESGKSIRTALADVTRVRASWTWRRPC